MDCVVLVVRAGMKRPSDATLTSSPDEALAKDLIKAEDKGRISYCLVGQRLFVHILNERRVQQCIIQACLKLPAKVRDSTVLVSSMHGLVQVVRDLWNASERATGLDIFDQPGLAIYTVKARPAFLF